MGTEEIDLFDDEPEGHVEQPAPEPTPSATDQKSDPNANLVSELVKNREQTLKLENELAEFKRDQLRKLDEQRRASLESQQTASQAAYTEQMKKIAEVAESDPVKAMEMFGNLKEQQFNLVRAKDKLDNMVEILSRTSEPLGEDIPVSAADVMKKYGDEVRQVLEQSDPRQLVQPGMMHNVMVLIAGRHMKSLHGELAKRAAQDSAAMHSGSERPSPYKEPVVNKPVMSEAERRSMRLLNERRAADRQLTEEEWLSAKGATEVGHTRGWTKRSLD